MNISPSSEAWISDELGRLDSAGLLRRLTAYPHGGGRILTGGGVLLNFSSNDYLGMRGRREVIEAASEAVHTCGAGAGASRLMSGTIELHERLEAELAAFKRYPSALVFPSGYSANVGIIPALAGRDDCVFMDRLCHASMVDGAILGRCGISRFNHNDPGHLDSLLGSTQCRGRKLVATESVFSMDGDIAPLKEIAAVAARHGAMLMVDEAHSTGVFGPAGSGFVTELGLEGSVNVSMGTLSKALGGSGGFAACSPSLRSLLVNRARSFIYSTALAPSAAAAALAALKLTAADPDMGKRLLANAERFRNALKRAGLDTGSSASQIVPVMAGGNETALKLSAMLRERNIMAVAIRPPTVPHGTARLRFSVTIEHSPADLDLAAAAVAEAASECRLLELRAAIRDPPNEK